MAAAPLSFNKSQKLLKPAEYGHVFAQASSVTDAYFTVLARPSGKSRPRLGLAIAKKRIKKAVSRNRIKRIVRESFRLHQHQLPAVDLIVIAKSTTARADRKSLWASLEQHWQRLQTAYPAC